MMDTSSRTSVALVRVLCARLFRIQPAIESHGPDLDAMLARADAALVIGDNALFWRPDDYGAQKIDLGAAWTTMTGLPFVWAFWAGRAGVATPDHVRELQTARDRGVAQPDALARRACPDDPERQAIVTRYLQENLHYTLGADERAGIETFYRYAAEAGVVPAVQPVRFF